MRRPGTGYIESAHLDLQSSKLLSASPVVNIESAPTRRDPEDLNGWFPLHRHSHQVFATYEGALAHAKAAVAWMIAVTR
jgi:hypothetical protein